MDRADRALADLNSAPTRTVYSRQWNRFLDYCHRRGVAPLPASARTVFDYLTDQTETNRITGEPERSYNTVVQSLQAIKYVHEATNTPTVNPETGTVEHIWGSLELERHLERLRHRYVAVPHKAGKPIRPLSVSQFQTMIRRARLDASTWQQCFHERRDSALLHLVGHSRAQRRDIEHFTVADLSARGEGRWVVPECSIRKLRFTVIVTPTSKAHICAPCAWTRWLEVHAVLEDRGTTGLIELLSVEDPASTHVCMTTDIDLSSLRDDAILFPAGSPANLQPQPLSGVTANSIFNRRFEQARIPRDHTSRYGLMSIHAAVEDVRDLDLVRRQRNRVDPDTFFPGFL